MRKLDRRPRPQPPGDRWFVYLLRCGDGSLYTGIAKDVGRRCRQHNAGTASRSTRCRWPKEKRLVLLGYGNFRDHHEKAHALMTKLKIGHEYRDGPARKHDWHSGWLREAVELLLPEHQERKGSKRP